MGNTDDYNAKIGVIETVPDKETKSPSMPVDVYVQESEDVIAVADNNKDKFTAIGVDVSLLEDALVRCGALREAESIWQSLFNVKEDAQKVWYEDSPKAYFMRDDLLDVQRFAFRKNKDLSNKVRNIAKGRGNADMIQDLNDIVALGRRNADYFAAINFDLTRFDEAAALSDRMATVLADAHAEEDLNRARVIRDKAYTHLKEVVDEIRDTGKFIFRYEPDTLEKFASDYFRKVNSAKNREDEETPEIVPNN